MGKVKTNLLAAVFFVLLACCGAEVQAKTVKVKKSAKSYTVSSKEKGDLTVKCSGNGSLTIRGGKNLKTLTVKGSVKKLYIKGFGKLKHLSFIDFSAKGVYPKDLKKVQGVWIHYTGSDPEKMKVISQFDFSGCPNVKNILVAHYGISSDLAYKKSCLENLYLKNLKKLREVSVYGNSYFKKVQIKNCPKLGKIENCRATKKLQISGVPSLYKYSGAMGDLSFPKPEKLGQLSLESYAPGGTEQKMKSLVDSAVGCWKLALEGFTLEEINLAKNPKLLELFIDNCSINTVSVKSRDLYQAFIRDNKIRKLQFSDCPGLIGIECMDNGLDSLLISRCPLLEDIFCYNNNLTELDVKGIASLTCLECDDNLLTGLDLSNNTELIRLTCKNNAFTSLDLSNNKKLNVLECSDNVKVIR